MKKIKILMVAGSMNVGGIENQLMHLSRNAKKEEYQIDYTSDMKNAFYREEIERLGGNFIFFAEKSRRNPIKYCIQMYRIMKNGHYDIVHSHELFHSGITLFLAWTAGVPCRFAHAHNWCEGNETGGDYSWLRKMYQRVMRISIKIFSTKQIACSTWAGEFVYGKRKMKKSSFNLVYNSVDTRQYIENYGKNEEMELSEKEGWKNVINVARITVVKNQTFLAEIAKELKNRGKKIRIICIGSGDEDVEATVRGQIEQFGIEEHLKLIGVRKNVDAFLRNASAFVLPSKYEGMPLVMIEAQAAGLPCISADTYSREVDYEIGMVEWLPLDDGAQKWADAIERAVLKEKAKKEDVVYAIERKGFDSKIFTEKLCNLYREDYDLRGKK